MTTSRFTTLFSLLALSAFNTSSAWASQPSQDTALDATSLSFIFMATMALCFSFYFYDAFQSKNRLRIQGQNFQQQQTSILALSRSFSDRVDSLIHPLTKTPAISPDLLRDLQAFQASMTQFIAQVNEADFDTCVATDYDEFNLFSEGGLKFIHFQQWGASVQQFEKQLQDLEQRFHRDVATFLVHVAPSVVVEESTPSSPFLRRFKTLSRSHVSLPATA